MEVQKLGQRTMKEVVVAARRIEKNPEGADRLQNGMPSQLHAGPDPDPEKGSKGGE